LKGKKVKRIKSLKARKRTNFCMGTYERFGPRA
jgi:hypothetical protein